MNKLDPRRQSLASARRIVVKVGSGVLTAEDGLNTEFMKRLAAETVALRNRNIEIILVSSGAIAAGFKKVGLREKPKTVPHFQACAAIGQARLMMVYEEAFGDLGFKVAQILLTADDLAHRRRYLNARNTLTTLLEWNIIPIINENDTVAVDEIKFGDNDTLSGLVAGLVDADLLINLTDIDGLYDRDPRRDQEARFISVVETVGPKIEAMASRIPGALGAGGMYTKVLAAKRVARRGVPTIIANGRKAGALTRILAGESEGTMFLPKDKVLASRKHWIAFAVKPKGRLVVDRGAARALLDNGKSLLPSGLLEVKNRFGAGDAVQVLGPEGELVAVGLSNYSSEELSRLVGCQTCDIEERLGYKHSDEVIHRNNMVVGNDLKS
ncbi:MAG: glutamate 5-kinase [Pseudomonadota bacterium]